MTDQETFEEIARELKRARVAFPGNDHLFVALAEEVGELAQALLQGKPSWLDEAIQVACVAVRIITEGDADFTITDGFACGDCGHCHWKPACSLPAEYESEELPGLPCDNYAPCEGHKEVQVQGG